MRCCSRLFLFSRSGLPLIFFFFFFKDTATTEFYPLPLHAALPILLEDARRGEVLGGDQPVVAGMRDHATATVDDHRLAVQPDAAVGREPLHLREVDGGGEKPD